MATQSLTNALQGAVLGQQIDTSSRSITLRALLGAIFDAWENVGIEFGVIHKGDLSSLDTSDLDLAFGEDPQTRALELLCAVAASYGFVVSQRLHYDVEKCFYFIVCEANGSGRSLHLDCMYDPRGLGRYLLSSRFLLRHDVEARSRRLVHEDRSAAYLLVKRAIKGGLTDERLDALRNALGAHASTIARSISRELHVDLSAQLAQLQHSQSIEEARVWLSAIRKSLLRTRWRRPGMLLLRWITTSKRAVHRALKPSGVMAVLIGPDGCGKSTVARLVLRDMARSFRKTSHFHWRPAWLPSPRQPRIADPSGLDRISVGIWPRLVAHVRFAYYLADFTLGYWIRIYPQLMRSTLVVGERYFVDVLVNPKRYGFHVSSRMLRTASYLVPNPTLTILLMDTPARIRERKEELSEEEIGSQIELMRKEISVWGNHRVIVTDQSSDAIALRVSSAILATCDRRTFLN